MKEENIEFIKKIKINLTSDLLKKEYREINKNNPFFGHCYVATETLFHFLKDKDTNNDFFPHHGKDENNITHWWLQNKDGKILDLTSEQYTSVGKIPPYKNGRRGAFLTKNPSKRSLKLMEKICA